MLDKFNEEDLINEREEEPKMKNIADFRNALDGGNLAGAEDFLNEVSLSPD